MNRLAVAFSAVLLLSSSAGAQGRGAAATVSPDVHNDRTVTFRIAVADARTVELRTPGDIPGSINPTGRGLRPFPLTKNAEGVWETTVGPVPAGAYRYVFSVNGIPVVDSRNPLTSQSNTTVYSLVIVPGSDVFDTRVVPHGAVAAVLYNSTALGGIRRMHVYTPPGYESGRDRYPVLYLLHGAGDSDESWSSVGRAGIILDNLIAAKKAKPMIVVMPAGHVNGAGAALNGPNASGTGNDEFIQDFLDDLKPFIEKHFRVMSEPQSRAIAGLSMGGYQTLDIMIRHLKQFAYVGVFSSGVLRTPETWERVYASALDDSIQRRGLKLLWFATGKDDPLISSTKDSVALMKKHGFAPVFVESEGGHTWLNWRDYLSEFAPQLFQ